MRLATTSIIALRAASLRPARAYAPDAFTTARRRLRVNSARAVASAGSRATTRGGGRTAATTRRGARTATTTRASAARSATSAASAASAEPPPIARVDAAATVAVREAVLWPGRPEMCVIDEDAEGRHFAALDDAGVPLGVISLFVDGARARFRKFAVLEPRRGAGVGLRLLAEAEAEARSAGAGAIACDARAHQEAFYAKRGYRVARSAFEKYPGAGEYVTMEKRL